MPAADDDVTGGGGSSWLRGLARKALRPGVEWVGNTRLARGGFARAIEGRSPLELAVANWRHATEEFRVLASFLAEAFNSSTSTPPPGSACGAGPTS